MRNGSIHFDRCSVDIVTLVTRITVEPSTSIREFPYACAKFLAVSHEREAFRKSLIVLFRYSLTIAATEQNAPVVQGRTR